MKAVGCAWLRASNPQASFRGARDSGAGVMAAYITENIVDVQRHRYVEGNIDKCIKGRQYIFTTGDTDLLKCNFDAMPATDLAYIPKKENDAVNSLTSFHFVG